MPDAPPDLEDRGEPRPSGREERYRLLFESATGTAIIGLDLEGRVTGWNAGAQRIFGYTEPEIAGQYFGHLFPAEDRASGRPEQTLARVLKEGTTESEHWLVRKGGERFWASGETVAARDDSGRLFGFTKIVRDFSERRLVEEALRDSESRFRTLADSAPVLIWVNGRDGCEFVNRAYLEFVGATLDQVVGDCWAEWIHPDDGESYLNAYKEAEARREVFHEKLRFRRADGEYRWMESIGVPRLTRGGEYLGYVGSTHDIHDMTAAAEALQQADLRKDEFLALLGHELRNPLAPLRSTLEAIRISAWNPETARAAWEIMSRQVQRLQRIVDDLLDISSIGQGKFELRREVVDFRETVRQAVEDSRGAFEGRSHMLSVSLSDDPLLVDGDPTRLEQIVVNLLNNAAKYTNSGGKIDVTLTVDQKDVVLAVRDNGIGIAPELLPRVFDLFTQGDRSSTRDRGGLGIGLSLVQKLVAMHGGKVSVESGGRDKGSTFTVRLPSAMNAVSVRPRSKSEKSVTSDARRLRVLVCDDNADAAASLALLLQLQGHEVVTARDGAEALEIAGAFHPEVALLDIGLPQMDGYELAQRMRAQNSHTKPALIALSGYGLEEDRNRSREAGFDAHLTKPVELEVLQEAIADLS
jgi:PAS domain S-box-containing protein